MAFRTEDTPPPVVTIPGSSQEIQAALEAAEARRNGGAASASAGVVPLWVDRPSSITPAKRGVDDIGHGSRVPRDTPRPEDFMTPEFAESHWVDMTQDEREEFADRAIKAGLWEPKDGSGALVRAWATAVNWSASYNAARPDSQGQWLSPWEAIERMYASNIAGMNGAVNGFTGWRTQRNRRVENFSESDIGMTARAVLQRELGRDPTDSEIQAYTVAANRAALENPQTVTTKTRDTAFDAEGRPLDSETVSTVEGEQVNPEALITDEVRDSQEHDDYMAATVYMPAIFDSLSLM